LTAAEQSNSFGSMPLMLLSNVFHYLDQADLSSCCQVSRWWNQVASRPSTWKSLIYTMDNMSADRVKRLGRKICQFIVSLTIDTSVSAMQLRILLKRACNLQSFTQIACRFSKHYTTMIKGATNAEILAALATNCPRLQELVLVESSNITANGLSAFATSCPQIKRLDVGKSCLSPDCCIVASQKWPGLVSFTAFKLKISRNAQQLSDASLQALACCPLRELMIGVKLASIGSVSQAILKCPLLEKFVCFTFEKTGSAQDQLLISLATACRGLKTICLPDIKIQTTEALESLLVNCPAVESTTLFAGPQVLQHSLQLIGRNWKQLRELNLTVEFEVSANNYLADLGTGCCQLKQLHLSFLAEFSATDGLSCLLKSCKKLINLKLICPLPKDSSPVLTAIISAQPAQVTNLYLSVNRSGIDASSLAALLAGPAATTPNLGEFTLSRADLSPELVNNLVNSATGGCLKSLQLANCVCLTDDCLASLGCLPCLIEIRLYKLKLITNYGVLCLSQTNAKRQLKVLTLHNGYLDDNLTNVVFDYLASFSGLKTLELRFWSCLTDAGIAKLAGSECAHNLTSLTVAGSALVTEEAAAPLRQHRQLSFQYKLA
ncbi:hypothetical protein BOX15_Mlig033168g4, partial [Macrostomum lignano]